MLYIDRVVIKAVKSRNKNLAMAWTDFNKTCNMVPHMGIIERLDLFGVAENIKNLLVNSTEKWKVILFLPISPLICIEISAIFSNYFMK